MPSVGILVTGSENRIHGDNTIELSTFAYVVGIVELLIGVPMILYPEKSTLWLMDIMKNDAITRIMGYFFVSISFLALKNDASTTFDVRV